MKKITLAISFIFIISVQLFAQSTVSDMVKKGSEFHDQGAFKSAIETYKKALEIDSKSTLANYEIAISYYSNGEYEQSIKHSSIVLKEKEEYMLEAYMAKGSALDALGKTKKSNKLFKKAIKETGGYYLLHYNLGLNYLKQNNLKLSEEQVIKAIEKNPSHSSSHLILAIIHDKKGNMPQAVMAAHYFLLLEPNSNRSINAHQILVDNFKGNVSEDDSDPNKINITISKNSDNEFAAIDLMISMLQVSKTLEENEGKSEDEMFIQNTESLFKMLGELKKEENETIWWQLYTTFFYNIAQRERLEAYCKYITQSDNENSQKWLKENPVKLTGFADWLRTID